MATYQANNKALYNKNNVASGRTSKATFNIDNLMGCVCHFDAGQLVYSDNGITPANNNDSVYYWGDLSPLGDHATNSGSGRPTYRTNQVNSLPAIYFAGNYLTVANALNFDFNTPSMVLVGKSYSGVYSNSFCGKGSGSYSDHRHRKLQIIAFSDGANYSFWSGTDAMAGCSQYVTTTNYVIYIIRCFQNNRTRLMTNGTEITQTASINVTSTNSSNFSLGCSFPNGVETGTTDIAEIAVYNRLLTNREVKNILTSLSTKYAITVANYKY